MSASGLMPEGGTWPANRKALQCGGWAWMQELTPTDFIMAMCVFTSLVEGRMPAFWRPSMSTRQMSSTFMNPLEHRVGEHSTRFCATRTEMLPPFPSTYSRFHRRRPMSHMRSLITRISGELKNASTSSFVTGLYFSHGNTLSGRGGEIDQSSDILVAC